MRLRNRLQFQRRMQERLRKQIIATDEKIWDAPISSKDDKFSTRLMQMAEQLITDPNFSPETLAVELGRSRAPLNRKLKGLLNQRTNDFIRSLRLKLAAMLLEKKAGNISEFAFEVGFNHLAYFARSFKSYYGEAPLEYKAN